MSGGVGDFCQLSTTDVKKHLAALLGYGLSRRAIAEAAGVSVQCIAKIVNGVTTSVRPATADQIMGVTLADFPEGHDVPAERVRAFVAAMREAGFAQRDIERMLGRELQLTPRQRVHHLTYQRVSTLYRLLAHRGLVPAYVLEQV